MHDPVPRDQTDPEVEVEAEVVLLKEEDALNVAKKDTLHVIAPKVTLKEAPALQEDSSTPETKEITDKATATETTQDLYLIPTHQKEKTTLGREVHQNHLLRRDSKEESQDQGLHHPQSLLPSAEHKENPAAEAKAPKSGPLGTQEVEALNSEKATIRDVYPLQAQDQGRDD